MANEQDPAQNPSVNPYDQQEGGEDASKFKSRPARGARRMTPEEAAKLIPGLEDVAAFQDPAATARTRAPIPLPISEPEAPAEPVAEVELQDPVVVAAERSAAEISAAFEAVLAENPEVAEGEAAKSAHSEGDGELDQAFAALVKPLDQFQQQELPKRKPKRMLWAAGVGAVLLGSGIAFVLPKGDTRELDGALIGKADDRPASDKASAKGNPKDSSKAGSKASAAKKSKSEGAGSTPDSSNKGKAPGDKSSAGEAASASSGSSGLLSKWLGERFDSGDGAPLPMQYDEPMVVLNMPAVEGEQPEATGGINAEPGNEFSGDPSAMPVIELDAETLALLESAKADMETLEAEMAALEALDWDGLVEDLGSQATAPDGEALGQASALTMGPEAVGAMDPEAAAKEAEAQNNSDGRAQRSAMLPVAEQLVMPAPLDNIARATKGDFEHIFKGPKVTPELLASERRLLTPGIGPVRVRLLNGEYFDGQLREAGGRQLVLATIHGSLTLDLARVEGVDHLDPEKPLVATAAPREGAELVRIRTRGGVIAGRVLVRDEHRVTIKLASGGEITLRDPEYVDGGVEASSVALVGLRPPQ
jgi:hypothetical protein